MAKTLVGILNVRLSAQTAAFSRGMSKASKTTKRFRAGLKRVAVAVAAFGAAAITAAAYSLNRLVSAQMENIDSLAKLSDRLNISTQNLAALRFQAQLAGSSAAGLDKALSIFVRRMGEVKQGSGEATRGLEMLNLSAHALAATDTGDAVKEVAERIRQLPTVADKAAAAYFLFGRSGAELVNMLNGGSAAMDDARKKTLAFGTAIDRKAAAKVEAANDAFTTLKEVFKGFGTTLAVQVAPYVIAIANKMSEMGPAMHAVRIGFQNGFGSAVKFISLTLDGVQVLGGELLKLDKFIVNIGLSAAKATRAYVQLLNKIDPTSFSDAFLVGNAKVIAKLENHLKMTDKRLKAFAGQSFGSRFETMLAGIADEAERIAAEMAAAGKTKADLLAAGEGFGDQNARGGPDEFRQVSLARTSFNSPQNRQVFLLEKIARFTETAARNSRLMGVN